jgi:hypothetical protein
VNSRIATWRVSAACLHNASVAAAL